MKATGHIRVRRSGLLALIAVGCCLGLSASSASAAFIYTRAGGCNPGPCTDSDYVYADLLGSDQGVVTVTQVGGNYDFFESNPADPITSVDFRCTQVSPNEATCPIVPDADGLTWDADAELHGGPDSIDMRTTRPARIEGGPGSDVLKGGSSDDIIIGDSPDPSEGTAGDDFIDGRGGADHMLGDGGTDTVSYASRSTPVNASIDGVANDGGSGEGDNIATDVENLSGSQGNDVLTGSGAANLLRGNSGNNRLVGGADNDSLQGGDGIDTLVGGLGADDMTGGPGTDNADYSGAPVPLSVNAFDNQPNDGAAGESDNVHSDVEVIQGGQSNDDLTPPDYGSVYGSNGNDTLHGGGQVGNDYLDGGPGNDTLDGGWGADILNGGPDLDTVDYSNHFYEQDSTFVGANSIPDGLDNDGNGQIDVNWGGPGPAYDNVGSDIENVIGSGGPDVIVGTADSNTLQGGAENDTISGDASADNLQGGTGDDVIHGEAGDDTVDGGTGADAIDGGADADTATYASRTAALRVSLDDLANDGETGEGDNVKSTVEDVRGGAGADTLLGSGAANRLIGGGGDDTLNGRLGVDTLDGLGGLDTITYSDRTTPVAVTLDGKRNDGADPNGDGKSTKAEEGDMDRRVENASGGDGADILRAPLANGVVNVLRGFDGDDTLNAREGTATVDSLLCGPGAGDRFAKDPADTQGACEVSLP
jgi:Ca2+-binding RTX toxin-like protein